MSLQPDLVATTARGEPITLRLPVPADVEAILAAATDPDTRRYTMIPLEFDRAMAEGFVARAGGRWNRGGGPRWVIADAEDRCVGLIDLNLTDDDPGAGEVFFIGTPAARGRGYVTAALRAVAVWALTAHGLDRVEWQALVGNDGSKKVADRAGFRPEGILRLRCSQRGVRHDAWVSSLTRADLTPAEAAARATPRPAADS